MLLGFTSLSSSAGYSALQPHSGTTLRCPLRLHRFAALLGRLSSVPLFFFSIEDKRWVLHRKQRCQSPLTVLLLSGFGFHPLFSSAEQTRRGRGRSASRVTTFCAAPVVSCYVHYSLGSLFFCSALRCVALPVQLSPR